MVPRTCQPVLFGKRKDAFIALTVRSLRREELDPWTCLSRMLRAHFGRWIVAPFCKIRDIAGSENVLRQERKG